MRLAATVLRTKHSVLLIVALASAMGIAAAGEQSGVHYAGSMKLDNQGYVRSMYNLSVGTDQQDVAAAGRAFLAAHARALGIADPNLSLKEERIDRVPGGSHVRFSQMHRGIPVYGSQIIVSSNTRGEIRMVTNNSVPDIEVATAPSLNAQGAIAVAHEYLHADSRWIGTPDASAMMAYRAPDGTDHLIYRVTMAREEPAGDWEVLVDAESGDVLKCQNMFVDYREGERVQGAGHVFLADPLSASRQSYGAAGFSDNDDQDSDSLTAYRSLVTLDSITYVEGMFWLQGPYCAIVDIESPVDSAPAALTPDGFSFKRGEYGFEGVNAYYHVTAAYKRLLELGFWSDRLAQIRIDPHGFQGKDNSHYSPTGNWISFGTGGVDDAEDADVIWHEYGHAIQYTFASSWGGGECSALGEGYADYWAASHSRSAGSWAKIDAPYNWIYKWDGHNEFWSGRILNDSRAYPFGAVSAHSAGQIWSSALMGIWDDLGRDVTDMLVIKSLFYLGAGATAVDAANAVIQADLDLYNGRHLPTLIYWLGTVKGFIDPAGLPSVSTDVEPSAAETPATFVLEQNYPNPFNPTTSIQFALSQASTVQLRVYNVIGQEVAVLVEGTRGAGSHTVVWDASNVAGTAVGSSMYIARLTVVPASGSDPLTFTRKMVLVR
jgi:hypothetical protein